MMPLTQKGYNSSAQSGHVHHLSITKRRIMHRTVISLNGKNHSWFWHPIQIADGKSWMVWATTNCRAICGGSAVGDCTIHPWFTQNRLLYKWWGLFDRCVDAQGQQGPYHSIGKPPVPPTFTSHLPKTQEISCVCLWTKANNWPVKKWSCYSVSIAPTSFIRYAEWPDISCSWSTPACMWEQRTDTNDYKWCGSSCLSTGMMIHWLQNGGCEWYVHCLYICVVPHAFFHHLVLSQTHCNTQILSFVKSDLGVRKSAHTVPLSLVWFMIRCVDVKWNHIHFMVLLQNKHNSSVSTQACNKFKPVHCNCGIVLVWQSVRFAIGVYGW